MPGSESMGGNPSGIGGVKPAMSRAVALLLLLSMTLAACSVGAVSPTPSPTPSPQATGGAGVDGLVAALTAAGQPTRQQGSFEATLVGGQGVLLCAGREEIRAYVFPTQQDRTAAANRIDPRDPSHIGNAIVEWVGTPRFWQRDRVLVLYLGGDAATETVLQSVLGPPFAAAADPGGGLPIPDASGPGRLPASSC